MLLQTLNFFALFFGQTPAIANSFALDGVVTLVDAKNLLERLRAGEDADDEDGATTEGEVDEAFQQIMFSDRIVINKARKCCASRPDKDNLRSDTNIFIPLNYIISHT